MTTTQDTTEPGAVAAEPRAFRRSAAGIVDPSAARVIALAGGYGSGKTELAVNLALLLARAGRRVQIADLDLVNPYFRCREERALMEAHGVRVVSPEGGQHWADLPIVLPEIAGMLDPPEGTVTLFDVGGDDVGARVLASLRPLLDRYELWLVLNARRPFNASVDACRALRAAIEGASRLTATGVVSNAHLADETTPDVIVDGWRLARRAADAMDLPLRFVAVMEELAGAPELAALDAPLLRMHRHMLPPWRRPATGDRHG